MTFQTPESARILNKTTALVVAALLSLSACTRSEPTVQFAASIEPAAMIVRELAGDRGAVRVLLPPGASPHHFEPAPSDARFVEDALATFYIDRAVDAWAARLAGSRAVSILDLEANVDGDHEHDNPHLWLDPVAVRACVPFLRDALIEIDPEGAALYEANAARFIEQLAELHSDVESLLAEAKGLAVVQAHSSWDRFLERYGIRVAGVLERTPGAPLPPRQFAQLSDAVAAGDVFAIIAEPQMPRGPLETLADDRVPIVELDPIGGRGDMTTYEALIRMNAEHLAKAAR